MYKSPIDLIYDHLVTEQENEVFKAVVRCGIDVDKDELIKALAYDRRQYDFGYADGKMDAEPHWIPCSERLPEENGTYLVYAPEYRGGSSRSKEWHDGIMFASFKGGKWTVEHGYYSKPNCVKAWMPLPKTDEVGK